MSSCEQILLPKDVIKVFRVFPIVKLIFNQFHSKTGKV